MSGLELPTILAIAGAGASAVQAIGQLAQGRSQAAALTYNARVQEQQAEQSRLTAAEEERRTRRDNMLRLGAASANRGASGVTLEGSPLEVLTDEAASAELRALDARYGGLMESRYYSQQASLTRAQASQARSSALFGAAGTLVGAGLNYGRSLLGGGTTLGAGNYGYAQAAQLTAAATRYRTPF